jgi:hypothetical protein
MPVGKEPSAACCIFTAVKLANKKRAKPVLFQFMKESPFNK